MSKKIKVGLIGLTLESHLSGIPGLRERMEGYLNHAAGKLAIPGVKVLRLGLVDHPEKARRAGDFLSGEQVEAVFVFFASGGEHQSLLPALVRPRVPVLILNLQPAPALNYQLISEMADGDKRKGEMLSFSQVRALARAAVVLNQSDLSYRIVSGWLEDDQAWEEITAWEQVIRARCQLRETRIGLLGNWECPDSADADIRNAVSRFSVQFEYIDKREIARNRELVKDEELGKKRTRFTDRDSGDLEETAEISCALDRAVAEHKIDLLVGCSSASEVWRKSILAKVHVPVFWEGGISGALACRILELLGSHGQIAALQSVDYLEEVLLWEHGAGVSSHQGEITCLGFIQDTGALPEMVVAQGISQGDEYPGMRIRYELPVRRFITEWAQSGAGDQCVIGTGYQAVSIMQLCEVLQIPCRKIC